jgi:hypothetical protein
MNHILLSTFLLLTAISTYGQTESRPQQCTLKLSQAPSVRGLKLNMTADELLALLPDSESEGIKSALTKAEGYPQFGEMAFDTNPSNWANKERFAGISVYNLRFFDRRLVGLFVRYESFPKGARWKNSDDLIQRFSASFHLPGPKDWEGDPSTSRRLKCDGFEVSVSSGDQTSIGFYALGWDGIRRERLAAFEEQKRREFKP